MLGSDGGGREAFWSDEAVREDVPHGSSGSPEKASAFVSPSPHPQEELGKERAEFAAGKAREVPAASPEGPVDLPPGIRLDENGRFVAGGYPTVSAPDFKTFDVKLDELLESKRALAGDMLNGTGEIGAREFDLEELRPEGAKT